MELYCVSHFACFSQYCVLAGHYYNTYHMFRGYKDYIAELEMKFEFWKLEKKK